MSTTIQEPGGRSKRRTARVNYAEDKDSTQYDESFSAPSSHSTSATSLSKSTNHQHSKKPNKKPNPAQVSIDIDFPLNWQRKPVSRDRTFFYRDFEGAKLNNGSLFLPQENETYSPDGMSRYFFFFFWWLSHGQISYFPMISILNFTN